VELIGGTSVKASIYLQYVGVGIRAGEFVSSPIETEYKLLPWLARIGIFVVSGLDESLTWATLSVSRRHCGLEERKIMPMCMEGDKEGLE
jgi:hypothetical protein